MEYACGRCLPCGMNRRRLWSARLMLESCLHESNLFCTLTYSPEFGPIHWSLNRRHVQLFLKRLRKALPYKIRYFVVGEYGTKYERPHYHALIFGCKHPAEVAKSWGYGYVHVGTVTSASVKYCTGYCTKGWTSSRNGSLRGRVPEFSIMSLKPGIGAGAMSEVVRSVRDQPQVCDIPASLRLQGKITPIGRYLRKVGRRELFGTEKMPEVMNMLMQIQFQELMKEPGAREARESKRLQAKAVSKWYSKFEDSKRSLS